MSKLSGQAYDILTAWVDAMGPISGRPEEVTATVRTLQSVGVPFCTNPSILYQKWDPDLPTSLVTLACTFFCQVLPPCPNVCFNIFFLTFED